MASTYFLVLSFLLALLSVLVWWRARSVTQWKIAILAGEYSGPWWLVTTSLIVSSYWILDFSTLQARLALGLLAFAWCGYARPWCEGTWLLRRLPARWSAAFPSASAAWPSHLLSLPAAARSGGRPETLVYTDTESGALSMDLHLPPAGLEGVPIVVVVHGGGWDGGSRDELEHFNRWLASRGFLVAAPDYRLAPQHPWPACADDIRTAIQFLQRRAGEWLADGQQVVLLGRSAGGQIAQAVAYQRPLPGVRGLISLYAPADLEFAWLNSRATDVLEPLKLLSQYVGGTYTETPAAYRDASPYLSVRPESVPTLLVHGRIDALVWHRQSERLHARLQALGVPSVFVDIPWGTHALEYHLNGPSGRLVRLVVERFLREVTSA